MAIIEFDNSPEITERQRMQSLKESVQRALDEINGQTGSSKNEPILIIKNNLTITSSSAVSDSKYNAKGYPYHIDIPITGCTANHMPEVMPTETAAEVMFYRCETLAGAVRVYVKNNSFGTVTISTIKCSKNFKEV